MTIGERIREIRKAQGLTQKELGHRLGLSYQSIAQWENGLRSPKLETILKIAQALGVRMEDLTGLETFDTGADFDKRRKELLSQAQAAGDSADSLTIIHTTDLRAFICNVLDQLNEEGQKKAAERVAELAEVPKYRKDAAKG